MFFMEEYQESIPDEEQTEDEITKRTLSRRKHVEVALNEFRREILDRRTKLHRSNETAVEARLKFENGIKRPYFHVKPLEREQLINWYNYLDFEISENKKKRIQVLFERCIISCALYEETWIKVVCLEKLDRLTPTLFQYAVYLDSLGDVDKSREIYQKAVDVHCSQKPGVYMAFSAFEEKHGKSKRRHAICPSNYPITQNLEICDAGNCELFLEIEEIFVSIILVLFEDLDANRGGDR